MDINSNRGLILVISIWLVAGCGGQEAEPGPTSETKGDNQSEYSGPKCGDVPKYHCMVLGFGTPQAPISCWIGSTRAEVDDNIGETCWCTVEVEEELGHIPAGVDCHRSIYDVVRCSLKGFYCGSLGFGP